MNKKILFVNQILEYKAACGIGQIGNSYANALKNHPEYNFIIVYEDKIDKIKQAIREISPRAVIYNYSPVSTPWINDLSLRQEFPDILHVRFMHDVNQWDVDNYNPAQNHHWMFNISSDPSLIGNQFIFPINRILPNPPTVNYVHNEIPVIGFHGFAFPHKGIHKIAEQVVKEFDYAIIKLHMPFAFYGDQNGWNANCVIQQVKEIIKDKPTIELITSHEMLEPQSIVNWLATNTINCYFFDYQHGVAPSSSLDFALAARRPIAVTKSYQMKHVWDLTPSILIEENSLKSIIDNGIKPVEHLYSLYSQQNVHKDFSNALRDKI